MTRARRRSPAGPGCNLEYALLSACEFLAAELGNGGDPVLAEQVLAPFEGAAMRPALRIGVTGFGLIAVCYGFARFAFGFFLPQIDRDLGLGPVLGGMISGGPVAGFLAAAAILAGSNSGLASRRMAAAVALALAGQWRLAFAAFALFAVVLALVTATALPTPRPARRPQACHS